MYIGYRVYAAMLTWKGKFCQTKEMIRKFEIEIPVIKGSVRSGTRRWNKWAPGNLGTHVSHLL